MREPLVTNVLAVLLVLPLFAARADAVPQDLFIFTSFEDVIPNSVPGEIIVVGVSPTTANFGGDAFAGVMGIPALYLSGIRGWMVLPNGTGVITFEPDAVMVEFWARARRIATADMVITAFDDSDVIVDGPVTISPGGWKFVSFSGRIARIDVVNLDESQVSGIDDFGFTPVPEIVDIRPFRVINRVQLGSHQHVHVAILGSETLDVTKVDVESLAFGPDGAPSFPGIKPALSHDWNRDGFPDFLAHFDMDATGISNGDTRACLTGEIDGARFEGCDAVSVSAPPSSQP